ncbi:MAG: hypothetical protein WAU88_05865 [Candidatus Zixiibacteriota bacterium]
MDHSTPGPVCSSADRCIQIAVRMLNNQTITRAQAYLDSALFVHAAARTVNVVQAHNGTVNAWRKSPQRQEDSVFDKTV